MLFNRSHWPGTSAPPETPNRGILWATSRLMPDALNAWTLFQTIKRIFTQHSTKAEYTMQGMIQLLGDIGAGQDFHIRPEFPRGSPSVIRVDNITLMHFSIYHDGLIVLQPLSVKDNGGKKTGETHMCMSSSCNWIPTSWNFCRGE